VDKDTLLTIVAVVASLVGFLNWTQSARKGLVEDLKSQVALLKQELEEAQKSHADEIAARDVERKKLRNRVRFLGKLALQRESENNKLQARMKQLNMLADNMGKAYNKTMLEVFALRKELADATGNQSVLGATAPLPTLPEDKP
jgi:hypothetical protein